MRSNTNKTIYMACLSSMWERDTCDGVKYLISRHSLWFIFGRLNAEHGGDAMAEISVTAEGEIVVDGVTVVPVEDATKTPKQTKKEEKDIISLRQFETAIPDEAAAIAFAEEQIWQGVPRCGRCGSENVYRVKNGKPMSHRCRPCRKHFSIRTGTVMAETNLPVRVWLLAIHLTLTARKGVSALQMHKHLGVTYPTAWFLDHRIREAMKQNIAPLVGVIEVDEAWIGGKGKSMHSSKKGEGWTWKSNKVAVVGLKQQNGNVIAFPVPDTYAETLQNAVLDHVQPGSTVYSDGEPAYQSLPGYGYVHEWVNHTTGEYVRDMVTTNGIESFWALLKRGYVGTFHYMSWKHLHRYCDEFSYRHNIGKGNGFRTVGTVLRAMVGKRLTYDGLTEKGQK